MSSLGLSGLEGWFLGSVTTRVVRSSPKPVLVVGGREISELALFLVALDGSETAERALDWALELAGLFGAKIVLYRFTGRSSAPLDAMAERQAAEDYLAKFAAAHGDRIHSTLVRQTDGPGYIAELATELGADVVFLGSRGRRSASTRWLLGSVAEDLVHHASCPVMVVP
jgi:nucleotide-binding universal stress UspA family protein